MAELFADLLGQPRAVALLESVLMRQRFAPAYLFAGPDGVGRRLATLRFLEGVLTGPQTPLAGSPPARRHRAPSRCPGRICSAPKRSSSGAACRSRAR